MSTAVKVSRHERLADPEKQFPQYHRVLSQVFYGRGIHSESEIDHSLKSMLSPDLLGGAEQAANLLHKALRDDQKILIIGDFDADGATSCALAMRALKAMGCANVDYLVPNRFEYGYGLTPEIVALAAKRHPDLIVTVDNGIASIEGVLAAKAIGCTVLVTDHHLQGDELPAADVIVNPVLQGEPFPSKNLAGVGVIFYVMAALRALLRKKDWFKEKQLSEPNLSSYLDLVALGTVADLVKLDKNNRILVEQGMRRIRSQHCSPGIQALLAVGKRSQHGTVTSDLGFVVAPRLNAAGRLDDMSIGIECLLCDDPATANQYAAQLDQLNNERKLIESEMKHDALSIMERLTIENGVGAGICLIDNGWHQGVIGILAARIKERYHRPTVIFALAEQGGVIKGSARSIPGIHIREVFDAIAIRSPSLMKKYGGHAMAAGLTLEQSDFEAFKKLFEEEVDQRLSPDLMVCSIESDGSLEPEDMNLELAELLKIAAPWGQGFPEPKFDGDFMVMDSRVVGGRHFKLKLAPLNADDIHETQIDAIAFNQDHQSLPQIGEEVSSVYRLDINAFRGNQNLQLVIEHLELKSPP